MNMNKHIVTNTNEEIMNTSSQSALLINEVFHYFVDDGGLEEGYIGIEEPDHSRQCRCNKTPRLYS